MGSEGTMSTRSRERSGRAGRRLAGGLTVVVGALATFVVASAFAANIQGTAKSDTLRGTAKADKLYGRGGDDRLFGLAGNDYLAGGPGRDVLTGGPGADVLSCGLGRDTAAADAADKVGPDCEVVRGRAQPSPTPTPTPPTATPTPTPTPTPAPPPPGALVGRYCGFTDSGGGICFDITQSGSLQSFTNARFEQTTDCQPGSRFRLTITFTGQRPVNAANLTFQYDVTAGELAGSQIAGQLDTQGNARGTLVMKANFDYQSTRYSCESKTNWTAKRGA
jgi:Ca2+-binding RTX toxin-like protein